MPPFSLVQLFSAAVHFFPGAEEIFEHKFAERFGFPYGLFFPYGRSALYTLLRAFGWKNEDVVVPAYTCAVVPHAIMLSGNKVRFVDSDPDHFNISAKRLASALNFSTKMVVPTPLFGYPVDRRGYEEIINRMSPNAFVLYDAAHGFGIEDEQGLQFLNADGSLFGLGLGKIMSSLYGGVLLLRDESVFNEIKKCRNREFRSPSLMTNVSRLAYGIAAWAAFHEPFLSFVDFLEKHTKLLYRFTEYYYGKSGPSLPENVQERPATLQARLGLMQLDVYEQLVRQRREISSMYEKKLRDAGFPLFLTSGKPTYSHFPIIVNDRDKVVKALRKDGIQVGRLIDYACPDLPGYEADKGKYPYAARFAQRMINLPNWPGMRASQVDFVIEAIIKCRDKKPDMFIDV